MGFRNFIDHVNAKRIFLLKILIINIYNLNKFKPKILKLSKKQQMVIYHLKIQKNDTLQTKPKWSEGDLTTLSNPIFK